MPNADYLIIGGGILGLTTARSLLQQGADRVVILEKETDLGRHASGRNSGVLHAGIYYPAGSKKAQFCLAGARAMKAYAAEKKIPCPALGKVIVAADAAETERLEALLVRAQSNGVPVERFSKTQLAEREPEAATHDWALFSPTTSVIDPKQVLEALKRDLLATGKCQMLMGRPLVRVQAQERRAITAAESISYKHLINVAGAFADRIAHLMGIGLDYQLLPFRGAYLKATPDFARRIKGLIYPVPDPALPFLGVHFTRSAHDDVYVGPTAAPAFGREHYAGLQGVRLNDSGHVLKFLGTLLWRDANGLRRHVADEMKKQLPNGIWRAARRLVPALRPSDLQASPKVGIRAQLIDTRTLSMVQDFVIENGANSTHVLNAVSPGFTASFAFGAHIATQAMTTNV